MDDYFAGSRTPAPGPAPAPPSASPYAAPAPAPWPPAPAPGYPSAYPSAYPPVQGWVPPAAAPGNSGRNVVLVIVGAVGALVLFGILAIAIPVFLNERSKAEASHTAVSVPAQVLGMPRLTDSATAAQIERLRTMPGAGLQFAGAYSDGRITVVVGAARSALGFDERRAYFVGASRSASEQGITLSKIKPGKLGGEMRCGAHRTLPMTICAFADGGSYGVVVVTGPAPDPDSTARGAREAFVHRT